MNVLYDFKVDKRYILGLLNSKLMSYFYAQKYFASHMQGGAFGFDTLSVGNLPTPKPNSLNQNLADEIRNLVDKIFLCAFKFSLVLLNQRNLALFAVKFRALTP